MLPLCKKNYKSFNKIDKVKVLPKAANLGTVKNYSKAMT